MLVIPELAMFTQILVVQSIYALKWPNLKQIAINVKIVFFASLDSIQ